MDDFDKVFGNKERIMVVFAHPDDAELYAGGTIARLIADGKRVRSVKMTSGGRGSRQEKISEEDLTTAREEEDKKAMQILGIKDEDNVYLRLQDGTVENNMEVIEKLVYQVREFQPDIIITHNPEDVVIRWDKSESWINHRDHRNTGISIIDATYPYSRDILFFPKHFKVKGLKSVIVTEFLLVDYYEHLDLVDIDITNFVEKRVAAHACHATQYDVKAAQESADFFTLTPEGRRRERFYRVIVD